MSIRLVGRSLRVVNRSYQKQLFGLSKRVAFATLLARSFHANRIVFNESQEKVSNIIKSELEFEQDDSFGLEEYHQNYLKESGFQLADVGESILKQLVKETDSEVIRVYFDVAQVTNEQELANQMDPEIDDQDPEELLDLGGIVSVNAVITKKADNSAVGVDLLLSSQTNEFSVNGITYFKDGELAITETAEANNLRQLKYSGPPFNNLADELQEAVQGYLLSRGIDTQLGDFIVALSTVKENEAYLSWLSDLKKFFS